MADQSEDDREQDYINGNRAAWLSMLRTCFRELGINDPQAKLVVEREQAISMLRDICSQHGDNDWPEDLNLADIIEKHLWKNLGQ